MLELIYIFSIPLITYNAIFSLINTNNLFKTSKQLQNLSFKFRRKFQNKSLTIQIRASLSVIHVCAECDFSRFIKIIIPAFIPTLPHFTHSDICKLEKRDENLLNYFWIYMHALNYIKNYVYYSRIHTHSSCIWTFRWI